MTPTQNYKARRKQRLLDRFYKATDPAEKAELARTIWNVCFKSRLSNFDGGPGSGNWGHAGRPGQRGGSAPGGGKQYRQTASSGGYTSAAKQRKSKKSSASTPDTTGDHKFGGVSSKDFSEAVVKAKSTLSKDVAWRVTAHTQQELDEWYPGAELHVTDGGSTVGVTEKGDIISLCKRKGDAASGSDVLQMAVANGGIKLDSYDGNHGFYVKNGFEPVSWCKWDSDYKPPDWDTSSGCDEENIIFYKYTGKTSEYDTKESFYAAVPASADYDEAQKKRDDEL